MKLKIDYYDKAGHLTPITIDIGKGERVEIKEGRKKTKIIRRGE